MIDGGGQRYLEPVTPLWSHSSSRCPAGRTPEHLITRFNEWVGVSPKKAARILRFEAFSRALKSGSQPIWSDLAAR